SGWFNPLGGLVCGYASVPVNPLEGRPARRIRPSQPQIGNAAICLLCESALPVIPPLVVTCALTTVAAELTICALHPAGGRPPLLPNAPCALVAGMNGAPINVPVGSTPKIQPIQEAHAPDAASLTERSITHENPLVG